MASAVMTANGGGRWDETGGGDEAGEDEAGGAEVRSDWGRESGTKWEWGQAEGKRRRGSTRSEGAGGDARQTVRPSNGRPVR